MASRQDPHPNLWLPFTCYQDAIEHPPLVIARGRGPYLYDKHGRKYLDAIGSWWVNILGHGNREIVRAVKQQLDQLEHVHMAGCITPPARELARLLVAIAPAGLTRVFFSDDGSTAVEVALKIALQYWALRAEKRVGFVALGGAYHGDTLGAMSAGMIPLYHRLFHERFAKQFFADSPYCYRCPVGKEASVCNAECMDSLDRLLARKGERIAACIFEPMVQGAAGMRVYPAKVLRRIFDACARYQVLTIADEVATGLGRTGAMFACDHIGATPDILCVAKGITGGFLPMGATLVREEIFREFCGDFASGRTFQHGHSYTGNPLAAAAGVAALRIMARERIPASRAGAIARFHQKLASFADIEAVGDIRAIGFIGALELVKNRKTKAAFPPERRIGYAIARQALKRGLLLRPLGDVIYFMPNYLMTENEIDEMLSLTRTAIRAALG